jgi:cytochrome d ubiquinol oxidase subunit I
MTIAAFIATAFAVGGLHAFLLLRDRGNILHQKAIKIAFSVGAIAALLQPLSGDIAAKDVAQRQPEKLAAMEAHFHTSKPADLVLGGIPDPETKEVNYAIRIPKALSFLAHGNFNAEVTGLDAFPEEDIPPVLIVHIAFQIMIFAGMLMAGVGLLFLLFQWKWKHLIWRRWFLILLAITTPLGFIAVEAGWTVTEVGRQPWIIYKVMRTADAVSPMPGLQVPLFIFTGMYLLLCVILIWLMHRQIKALPRHYSLNSPNSPKYKADA